MKTLLPNKLGMLEVNKNLMTALKQRERLSTSNEKKKIKIIKQIIKNVLNQMNTIILSEI